MQLRGGLNLGRPLRIPLLVHGSWLPAAALLVCSAALHSYAKESLPTAVGLAVATVAIFFLCVVLHELGHGVIARAKKVRTIEATLFVFGGLARTASLPATPRDEFQIALAGPVMSGLLAGGFAFARTLTHGYLSRVFWALTLANAAFAVFSLLPGLPLDGGRLLAASRWKRKGNRARATRSAARIGRLIGLVCAIAGVWLVGNSFSSPPDAAASLWLILTGAFVFSRAGEARRSAPPTRVPDVAAASWARPFAGRIPVDQIVPAGGGPYAVSDGGRLAGVLTPRAIHDNAGRTARDAMVPWDNRMGFVGSEPLERALERLARNDDTVLVVLDENGVVRGVLDTDTVREKIGAT